MQYAARQTRQSTKWRAILSALTVLAVALATPAGGWAEQVGRTRLLLVSIDGLRAVDVRNADKNHLNIPNLRKLMAQGVQADHMVPVYPTLTYPCHTSLVTGVRPCRHGICFNRTYTAPGGKPAWYWYASQIKVETLWQVAERAGLSVALVGWPCSVGAKVHWNFPEIWQMGRFEETVIPMSRSASTPGLIDQVEKAFGTKFDLAWHSIDEMRNMVARFLVRKYRPDIVMLHYNEPDNTQHLHGPASPQARRAIEKVDSLLGALLDEYRRAGLLKETVICVLSDHGFLPVRKKFKPAAVLAKAGLITLQSDGTVQEAKAWVWSGGGCAGIVLAEPANEAMLQRLFSIFEPYTTGPDAPIHRILMPKEIRRLGCCSAAAIMLDANSGWTFGRSPLEPAVTRTFLKGQHGHLPDREEMYAVFTIAGPGIGRGRIRSIRMIDVAPTLANLLGLHIPQAEGRSIADNLRRPTPTQAASTGVLQTCCEN